MVVGLGPSVKLGGVELPLGPLEAESMAVGGLEEVTQMEVGRLVVERTQTKLGGRHSQHLTVALK